MKKIILLFIFTSFINFVFATKTQSLPTREVVGGWYPIFFDRYDEDKINLLLEDIKQNKVAKIVVNYTSNYTLASKILTKIQSRINFAVFLSKDNNIENSSDTVAIIVWNMHS